MNRKRAVEIRLNIEDLDSSGFGVGYYENRPVHVRSALPGEEVTAIIKKRNKGQWYGIPQHIDNLSNKREVPACEYFNFCGACTFQHMKYDQQLIFKQKELLRQLDANNVKSGSIRAPKFSKRLNYRRKARLGIRSIEKETFVGFREVFSGRITRMNSCKTLDSNVSDLLPVLKATVDSLDARNRIPQAEVVRGDKSLAVLVRHLEELTEHDLTILRDFAHRNSLWLYLQSSGYDGIELLNANEKFPPLGYGLEEFGVWLEFSVTNFIQANTDLNKQLVWDVVNAVKTQESALVVDMFCGIGNFSIPLAREGMHVLGFEMDQNAVDRANANASINGVAERCRFQQSNLYGPKNIDLQGADTLLLDPPRSGAGDELVNWVSGSNVQRIIYVSCNPTSFAKDAAVLNDQGFLLEEVGIFDMFPQTTHIETLGIFVRGYHG